LAAHKREHRSNYRLLIKARKQVTCFRNLGGINFQKSISRLKPAGKWGMLSHALVKEMVKGMEKWPGEVF